MKRFYVLTTLVSLLSLPAYGETPNPGDVAIQSIEYHGTGCPKQTAAIDLAPDFKAFTVLFSQYQAQIDTAKRLTSVTRYCEINISLKVPDGWSFMVFTVDYRGYVALTDGATAELESRVRFRGVDPHSRLDELNLQGPKDENYFFRHQLNAKTLQRSSCRGVTRHLGIKSNLTVTAKKGASALMTVDSADGEVGDRKSTRLNSSH